MAGRAADGFDDAAQDSTPLSICSAINSRQVVAYQQFAWQFIIFIAILEHLLLATSTYNGDKQQPNGFVSTICEKFVVFIE
jgi:hypothetical protein